MGETTVDDNVKESGSGKSKETAAETAKSSTDEKVILNVGGIKVRKEVGRGVCIRE